MAKFTVSGTVTVSAYTIVEAESEEEAREIAAERLPVLGGIHSGARPEEDAVIDDADGEFEITSVESR